MTLEEKALTHRLLDMRRAQELESVTKACRQLGLSRTLFYRWRRRYLRARADSLKPWPPRRGRCGCFAGRPSARRTLAPSSVALEAEPLDQ